MSGVEGPRVEHTDVGAYLLGLLEPADRRAFEAHLRSCGPCRGEMAALRGVAASLEGMPPIGADTPAAPRPDPAVVAGLIRRRAAADRRRRVSQALVGVAAGLVLMGGAAGLGATVGGAERSAAPAAGAELEALFRDGRPVAADDRASGVSGMVVMEPRAWGSRVGLRLSRVRGPLECELVAVDRDGRRHAVVGWSVPEKGYGTRRSPAPLTIEGGTALSPGEIARFEVRTIGGDRTLLTLPTA